jgi:hypothetical protein
LPLSIGGRLAAASVSKRLDRDQRLTRAHLLEADLTRAQLTGAILTGAKLGEADLTEAELILQRLVLLGASVGTVQLGELHGTVRACHRNGRASIIWSATAILLVAFHPTKPAASA